MPAPVRVAITGAAGQIGYSLLFRVASGEMLGPNQPVILQLLEITPALDALRGVAMELEDCAFPLLEDVVQTDDPNAAFGDANYALLVGSVPRKAGMERSDLLTINGKIFTGQGKALSESAAPDIKKMTIWGNHSATQYPDLFHCEVSGKNAAELVNDQAWLENDFIPTVQKRGAAIIEARGLSSAASAANAAVDHMRTWALGTGDGDWVSMAVPSDGSYGVADGLISSFPATCTNGEWSVVQGLDIDDFSRGRIDASVAELAEERDAVRELGLI